MKVALSFAETREVLEAIRLYREKEWKKLSSALKLNPRQKAHAWKTFNTHKNPWLVEGRLNAVQEKLHKMLEQAYQDFHSVGEVEKL